MGPNHTRIKLLQIQRNLEERKGIRKREEQRKVKAVESSWESFLIEISPNQFLMADSLPYQLFPRTFAYLSPSFLLFTFLF